MVNKEPTGREKLHLGMGWRRGSRSGEGPRSLPLSAAGGREGGRLETPTEERAAYGAASKGRALYQKLMKQGSLPCPSLIKRSGK